MIQVISAKGLKRTVEGIVEISNQDDYIVCRTLFLNRICHLCLDVKLLKIKRKYANQNDVKSLILS